MAPRRTARHRPGAGRRQAHEAAAARVRAGCHRAAVADNPPDVRLPGGIRGGQDRPHFSATSPARPRTTAYVSQPRPNTTRACATSSRRCGPFKCSAAKSRNGSCCRPTPRTSRKWHFERASSSCRGIAYRQGPEEEDFGFATRRAVGRTRAGRRRVRSNLANRHTRAGSAATHRLLRRRPNERLIASGELEGVRVRRSIRVTPAAFDAYISGLKPCRSAKTRPVGSPRPDRWAAHRRNSTGRRDARRCEASRSSLPSICHRPAYRGHYFGSPLVAHGADAATIRDLMGHSSLAVTIALRSGGAGGG